LPFRRCKHATAEGVALTRAKLVGMNEHKASRTLVKSPPELWAECSDATSLTRHLDQFGEIRITRLEPETAVAWEGDRISGTVRLEPSGWGTKVTLTATTGGGETPLAEVPEPSVSEPAEVPVSDPAQVTVSDAAEMPVSDSAQVTVSDAGETPISDPAEASVVDGAEAAAATDAPGAAETPGAEVRAQPELPPRPAASAAAGMSKPRRGGLVARLLGLLAPRPTSVAGPPAPALREPVEPQPATEAPETDPEPEGVAPAPVASEAQPAATAPEPVATAPEPVATESEPVATAPESVVAALIDAEAALGAALDSLGQAHHRPFSRA
jgi:hypothetical protein